MSIIKNSKFVAVGLLLALAMPFTAHAASYTVVKDDSLYTVGKLFGTTSTEIMKSNNLSGTTIVPGQKLNVPGEIYTVKSGDSLYLIAKKYAITIGTLRKANDKWDDVIYPGQKLVIPGTISNSGLTTKSSTGGSVIAYSETDLDLLARLVTAEAESEPYNAKVAVAAVVINRVKSSEFPNTISSVIYEKSYGYYQFTPVENGWISKAASEDSKKAAYEALHGSDPSKGALYYFDDSATNRWLWSKPITARIGKMVYVY